jgi:hypothetical protein
VSSESPLEEALRLDLPLAAEIDAALDRERNRHETALSLVEAQNLVRTGILDAIDDELDAAALERDLAPLLFRMSKFTRSAWPVPMAKDVDAFVATIEKAAKSLLDPQRSSTDEEWNERQLEVMIALDWDLGQLYDFVLKGTTLFLPSVGIGWLDLTLGAPLPTMAAAFYASEWPELVARKFEAYRQRAEQVRTSGGSMPLPIPRELATGGDLAPVVVVDLIEQATRRGQEVLDGFLEKGGKTQPEIEAWLEQRAAKGRRETRGGARKGEYAERRKTDARRNINKLRRVSDWLVRGGLDGDHMVIERVLELGRLGFGRFGPEPAHPTPGLSSMQRSEAAALYQKELCDAPIDAEQLSRPTPRDLEAVGLRLLPVVGQAVIDFLDVAILIMDRALAWLRWASGPGPGKPYRMRLSNLVYSMVVEDSDDLTSPAREAGRVLTDKQRAKLRKKCIEDASMLMRDLSQLLPALMSKNASTQPDKGRYHTLRHVYREGQGYHAHTHLDQAWPDALKAIEDLEFTCQDPWRKGRPDGQLWQLEDILVFLRYDLEQARANTKTVDVSEGRDVYLLPYILASLSQLYGRSETLTQGRLAWLVQELGEPFYLTDKTGERQKQRDEGLRAELRERAHAETPSHPGAGPLEVLRDQAVRTRREWDGVRKLYKATLRKFPQELIDAQIGALSPGQIPSRESDHLARTFRCNPVAPRAARAVAASALKRRRARARQTRRPGGTQVGVARARDISSGRNLSERTLARTRSFFARHDTEAERAARARDPTSPAAISWDLWGGDPMRAWLDKQKK